MDYTEKLIKLDTLDFDLDHYKGSTEYSLSNSDVVVFSKNGKKIANNVDSFGSAEQQMLTCQQIKRAVVGE